MSSCRETAVRMLLGLTLVAAAASAMAQTAFPGVGRAATPKEVQAWDIDVRPDFKGLPAGAGSVAMLARRAVRAASSWRFFRAVSMKSATCP